VTTTIYLVRHGRTALNAEGRFRGLRDVPLDDQGFVEAAAAGHALKDARLSVVHASPLRRTIQTAEFVASAGGGRVVRDARLIDLDHGRWEALTPEEAERDDREVYRRFREDPRSCTPPGGEAVANVERRVLAALSELGATHQGASVAAVSHEIPIRLVVSRLLGVDGADVWDIDVPTGAATEIRFDAGELRLASIART
jgi:broad specificity phosphatase PhoE